MVYICFQFSENEICFTTYTLLTFTNLFQPPNSPRALCSPEHTMSHCGTSHMGGHSDACPFPLLLLQSSIKSHLAIGAGAGEGSPRGFCLILGACRELGSGLYWQNHSGMRCRKPKSNYCYENILFTVKEKRKLNFLRAFSFFYLFPAEFSSCCFTLSALTNVFRDY